MKPMMILGIALVVLGSIGLAFRSISYMTNEKVLDLGGIQVTAETQETVPIPLIAGGLVVAVGIVLVVVAAKKA